MTERTANPIYADSTPAVGQILALDIGTSAVRAGLVGADGSILASSRVDRHGGVGGGLFDAEELYRCVLNTLREVAPAGTPRALSLSAHIGTIPVDQNLNPLDQGGGWSDSRGLDEFQQQDESLLASVLDEAGRPRSTGGALAYALQARRREDINHRLHALLSPKDFVVARLTGQILTDTIDAAYTLASAVRCRTWNHGALEQMGLDPSIFPPQTEPLSIIGELSSEASHRTGLPQGLPVAAGGPDGSIGIAVLLGDRRDRIADIAGTTDVLGRLIPDETHQPQGTMLNPAVLPELFAAVGATGLTGGAVTHWRGLIGSVEAEEVMALPPGACGLKVLTSLTGARFPHWKPKARGAVLGQGTDHGPAHLLRAVHESVGFTVREAIDVLDPDQSLPVVLAGGVSRSRPALQLRANILNRPLMVQREPEITLLGAAAVGFAAIEPAAEYTTICSALLSSNDEVLPQPQTAEDYAQLYDEWRDMRDAVECLREL
ncbi:xylulokinase [Nesterenkonia ebinurensis]|uniref:xylulokinase n=1 Tax=Nesterenkonia ebinurensis TaxID=2608252 RepID=UPI001CC79417|nr:FGGY-family carbohydrate kinase [Nesterenkonia ebinurensis]